MTIDRNSAEWGWQPQETAPRDGSRILVSRDYTDITIAAFVKGKFRDPWTDRPLSGEWQWMKINEVIRQTK